MGRCSSCGQEMPLDADVCPHCGAVRASSSGGGGLIVFLLLFMLLPPLIYNPIFTHKYLIKERYFDISESGRKLAYWTSYIFFGLVMFILYFAHSANAGTLSGLLASMTLVQINWLVTIVLVGIGVAFALEIVKTVFQRGGIIRGFLHLLAVLLFLPMSYVSLNLMLLFLTGTGFSGGYSQSGMEQASVRVTAENNVASNSYCVEDASSTLDASSVELSSTKQTKVIPSAVVIVLPSVTR